MDGVRPVEPARPLPAVEKIQRDQARRREPPPPEPGESPPDAQEDPIPFIDEYA